MQAFEQGLLSFDSLKDDDIFEIQHRHLLQCLEKATERELIERDIVSSDNLRTTPPISPSTSQGLLPPDSNGHSRWFDCCNSCYRNSPDTGSINRSAKTSRKESFYEPNKSDHKWRSADGQQEQQQQHQMDQRKLGNALEANRLFSTSAL
ncbi:hypothetical protein LOAG_15107 [Loa loa]|nr:hypothetical protein LOAG_15107 [Loa loa]EFO13422.1 hypothetical protein LOAG_15107 [Loa loa]